MHFRRPATGGTEEDCHGFLAWIVVGLIAGWLAGQVMKGGGYGVIVDIILGRHFGWLDLRDVGNLARWRHDWVHRCCIRWRGDLGLDYPLTEKSMIADVNRVISLTTRPGSMSEIAI